MIWFRIAIESFIIASKELFANKLRSVLSLFGIAIGILCLISVFSAINSLQQNIERSINSLGGDIVYVGKWPWLTGHDYPWWKFIQRPEVNIKEYERLVKAKVQTAQAIAFSEYVDNFSIKSEKNTLESVSTYAITPQHNQVRSFEIQYGRYFNNLEFEKAFPSIILGHSVATVLFGEAQKAIGKTIKVGGKKIDVIGVLKVEGEDILGINQGFGLDNTVYLSYRTASFWGSKENREPFIMVKAKENIPLDEVEAELEGKMRSIRRLSPQQENNFALNRISVFTQIFKPVFSTMFWIGLLIGGFSIVVGVFGIANIMFVSVKERTSIIGVKKALGAKRNYILLEFFIESILISLLGGILGLLAVQTLFFLMNMALADSGFQLLISGKNLWIGVAISIVSGILAGFIPAYQASKMNPVEAMRS